VDKLDFNCNHTIKIKNNTDFVVDNEQEEVQEL